MSVISLADINHAILYGSFTNEQLNSIGDAIKFARGQIATRNKFTMRAGSQVKFTNNQGQTILATVEKVNRKFIMVRENGKAYGTWRVPANMLTAA